MASSFQLNVGEFDKAMKKLYPISKVTNFVYRDNPLLAMMPKVTNFSGENLTYAVQYGLTGGRSATFSTAKSNRSGTPVRRFVVDRRKDYAVVSVDNETMLASRNGGSLLEATKTATDAALLSLSRAMGMDVYRDGSGSIGAVASVPTVGGSPSVDTFIVGAGESVNFEVGQNLQLLRSSALVSNGDMLTVTKVDRDSETIEHTVGPVVLAGDKLVGAGDYNLKVTGIDSWIPATAPGSNDNFYGCNRSVDPTRLAGQRIVGTGSSQEAIIDAAIRLKREGGRPDAVFVNPFDWGNIAKSQEGSLGFNATPPTANRRHGGKDSTSSFGFQEVTLNSQAGSVRLVSDHNCPLGVAYMLQMDTWEFRSIGAAPRQLGFDGVGSGLRQTDHDGVEYRWGYYGNIL